VNHRRRWDVDILDVREVRGPDARVKPRRVNHRGYLCPYTTTPGAYQNFPLEPLSPKPGPVQVQKQKQTMSMSEIDQQIAEWVKGIEDKDTIHRYLKQQAVARFWLGLSPGALTPLSRKEVKAAATPSQKVEKVRKVIESVRALDADGLPEKDDEGNPVFIELSYLESAGCGLILSRRQIAENARFADAWAKSRGVTLENDFKGEHRVGQFRQKCGTGRHVRARFTYKAQRCRWRTTDGMSVSGVKLTYDDNVFYFTCPKCDHIFLPTGALSPGLFSERAIDKLCKCGTKMDRRSHLDYALGDIRRSMNNKSKIDIPSPYSLGGLMHGGLLRFPARLGPVPQDRAGWQVHDKTDPGFRKWVNERRTEEDQLCKMTGTEILFRR
jgi:hypothetical protein